MVDNRGIINIKLGSNASIVSEEMLETCIDEVTTKIKEYCNIDYLPNEIKYTHANMVVDLVKYYLSTSGDNVSDGNITSNGVVSSINLGDMSLSMNPNSNTDSSAHANILDSILFNYKDSLNTFRNINNYL